MNKKYIKIIQQLQWMLPHNHSPTVASGKEKQEN